MATLIVGVMVVCLPRSALSQAAPDATFPGGVTEGSTQTASALAAEDASGGRTPGVAGRDEPIVGPSSSPLPCRSRRVDFGAALTVASTYVYRGEPQYGSMTIPSFQPAFWLDFSSLLPGSLRFDFWSALAMTRRELVRQRATASEVDLSLRYEHGLAHDTVHLGGGFIYYLYPGEETVDGEKELFASIVLTGLPVQIETVLWLEVAPGLELTIEPRVAWEHDFGDATLGIDVQLGAHVTRGADNAVDHVTTTVALSQRVGVVTVGGSVSYTYRISESGAGFLDRSLLYGAVEISAGE